MRFTLVLLFLAPLLTPVATRGRPATSVAFVEQARSLPAEFHSDLFLRLAQSELITDPKWKQELVEDAFWTATGASLQYAQIADGPSSSVDMNAVRQNGLEALTLKARAVQIMLDLDPKRATYLFDQVHLPALPELDCSVTVTPDLTSYYQAALRVYEKGMTDEIRAKGDDIKMIERIVQAVEAPSQVSPVYDLIFTLKLTPDTRRDLLAILAGRLQTISRSDREFGAAERQLTESLQNHPLPESEAVDFLPALRMYIVHHIHAKRCTEYVSKSGMSSSAVAFNDLAVKVDPDHLKILTISTDDARATGDAGTYTKNWFGQSKQSSDINEELRWLTNGNRGDASGRALPWTLAERSSRAWTERFNSTLARVHNLTNDDEPSLEAYFCMKSDALNALAGLAPPGRARQHTMDEFVEFLEDYYPSIDNKNLWFTMFRHMLYTARFSEDQSNKTWLLVQMERSRSPVVAAYARTERVVGPPVKSHSIHVQ